MQPTAEMPQPATQPGTVIRPGAPTLVAIADELRRLREAMVAAEVAAADRIAAVHPQHRRSATNLVHYVEFRNHDVRDLQRRLGELGLSSLGRSEPHVLATVEAVLSILDALSGRVSPVGHATVAIGEGNELLAARAASLLGPCPADRVARIMVTLPSEAADDGRLVERMVASGMDIARVNCAHDDEAAWARMIDHVRAQSAADGRRVTVAMDLAGPKLRTGSITPGPSVMRVAPTHDRHGRVTIPAEVRLVADQPADVDALRIPVTNGEWLSRRTAGEKIELTDARGARRRLTVVRIGEATCVASTSKTTYIEAGTELVCRTAGGDDTTTVGAIPPTEQWHRVLDGDRVLLTRSLDDATPAPGGRVHRIGCSLPELFGAARVGHRIWFDDGRIGGTIDAVGPEEIGVTISEIGPRGANLKSGKGINVPDTDLPVDALTDKDIRDLAFVARRADIVNLSFVREPNDVARLQAELDRLDGGHAGGAQPGIVLKIETVAAFENLPDLLLTAMRSEKVGVMIARGDLAVEVGFNRLAEVQEEIMWACEAAHVPVIWATQVLESLAKKGLPSRAEITDAAMAERTECVMLNKGPHIVEAIAALDSILRRMREHQDKKRSLLRRLASWDGARVRC